MLSHGLRSFHEAILKEGFVLEIEPQDSNGFRYLFIYEKPNLNWRILIRPQAMGEILKNPQNHTIYHSIEIEVPSVECWNLSARVSTVDPEFNPIEEVMKLFKQLTWIQKVEL